MKTQLENIFNMGYNGIMKLAIDEINWINV